jgi:hypothetical protein
MRCRRSDDREAARAHVHLNEACGPSKACDEGRRSARPRPLTDIVNGESKSFSSWNTIAHFEIAVSRFYGNSVMPTPRTTP